MWLAKGLKPLPSAMPEQIELFRQSRRSGNKKRIGPKISEPEINKEWLIALPEMGFYTASLNGQYEYRSTQADFAVMDR